MDTKKVKASANLISQGSHRFYSLTLSIEDLEGACYASTREEDQIKGFQRVLDLRRVDSIAEYVDNGGVIPGGIILSAQELSMFSYDSKNKSITYLKAPKAFLIIDGQHRMYGFQKATTKLRIPIIVFNNLSKQEEARLFIDINTLQKPVPNELLLDIKKLAQTETEQEDFIGQVFDLFHSKNNSSLKGRLSPHEKKPNKISRPTFYKAFKIIYPKISTNPPEQLFEVMSNYFYAISSVFSKIPLFDETILTNSVVFTSLISIFPKILSKHIDKYGKKYSIANFEEVLSPLKQLKSTLLSKPTKSYKELAETLLTQLESNSISL